ncbi:general substrate transporter [Acaromyces ingoldii]|uniref:General substrate transporter n=1 Tax=Acaromyces ingoldii TaxID=215250 RepID=A0A316YXG5_9BASI|nr:general substrate transporter [Acaromyces ingoldii]PWN92753.1 general substrate transporter [Acaromyces ingoldii]
MSEHTSSSFRDKDDTAKSPGALETGVQDANEKHLDIIHGHDDGDGAQITLASLLLGVGICVGGFLFGYDIGVISGCLVMPDFINRFGAPDPKNPGLNYLPDEHSSLITSLLSAGTFFGALLQAPVSDYAGRKASMLVWAGFFTVGAIVQTASGDKSQSANLAQIVAGRFIAGLGVGALSGLCPLYLAETAPKSIRGAMVSCYQLLIIFGIFLSYAISYGTHHIETSSASWRVPVGLQCAWGLGLVAIMIFLPESPRWLLQRERPVEARRIMANMRGITLQSQQHNPIPSSSSSSKKGINDNDGALRGDAAMEADLQEMVEGIEAEAAAFAGRNYITAYALCFGRKGQMWRRTLTGMMLQTLQQLCGQNFYYYYGPTFFKAAGTQLDPLLIQLIFGAVSLACTVPALITIENVGRRKSLLVGAAAQAFCAYVVAFVGHYGLAPDKQAPQNASQRNSANAFIAFAVLHLAAFSALWGPTPWVYLSESFPQHLRAKSISLGSAANWFWNFMLSYFSNKIAAKYGPFIMLIFGSVMIFAVLFVFFAVPEVKGLTLEQVDEMYDDRSWASATSSS